MSTHAGGQTGSRWPKLLIIAAALGILLLLAFVVSFFGIILWQLGIFNMGSNAGGGAYVTSTGFSKIKPQLAGTSFTSDGEFKTILTNGVGVKIILDRSAVTVKSTDGIPCDSVSLENGEVLAGDNIHLVASGCPKTESGLYQLKVTIPYRITIGTMSTNHTDIGTIRGSIK